MSLRAIMQQDQAKVFSDLKGLGEAIVYTSVMEGTFDLVAIVEREDLLPHAAAGYGAMLGRETYRVWIPKGEDGLDTIQVGVDTVTLRERADVPTLVTMVVSVLLPDSDTSWHLELTR